MAVILDQTQIKVVESDVTSTTWTHICSGENRILLIFISCNPGSTPVVTYNNLSCTLVDSVQTPTNPRIAYLFKLSSPPTGSAYTISVSNVTSGYIKAYSISLTGVSSTSPLRGVVKNTGSGFTGPTDYISSSPGEIVCDIMVTGAAVSNNPFLDPRPSGSPVILNNNTYGWLAAAGYLKEGGDSIMMGWSYTVVQSVGWAHMVVSVRQGIISPIPSHGIVG
jgi:hypothetical protein